MQTMTRVSGAGPTNQQYFFSAVGTGNSDYLEVPNTGNDALVVIVPDANQTATVQFSISSAASLKAGTGIWLDWDQGAVTAASHARLIAGVTALRVTSSGGYKWEAVA
jgi:hypothetical protein